MPIEILWRQDLELYCPIVRCDLCNRSIDQVEWGMAVYYPVPTTDRVVRFLHKGDCDRDFMAANGGRREWLWEELEGFLAQLAVNVRKLSAPRFRKIGW